MASNNTENTGTIAERDILKDVHRFIDSNIRLVKNSLYVVGGIGVVVLARSIYMTRVFTRIEDIPSHFYTKHFRLVGNVTAVRQDGVLDIQHVPIMMLRVPFVKQEPAKALPVHLACIDVSLRGRMWLEDNVLHKDVWFHLLHKDSVSNTPMLYSRIELRKKFQRNIQVNEELVKLGLCKIWPQSSFDAIKFPTDKNMLLFLDRLINLENRASQKGVGMWTDSQMENRKKRRRKAIEILKYVVSSPFKIVQWIYKKSLGRKK